MGIRTLGKYELLEVLGRGGYGTVYRGRETVLDVERAVKVLHPALASDPEFIERFRREARLAARLEHPHIVPVYELDEANGSYFLAMKYLPGGALKDLLAREGCLPFGRALEITRQVAAALDFAHAQGLVHRDVKPGNILLEADGTARLGDFGFAKALSGAGSAALSTSGGMIGTPAYMAPETWRSQPAAPAADIYSLACVFYEMLTGKVLFDGDSPPEIMTKHVLDGPQLPAAWPEGTPEGVDAALRKALSRKPEERYASAGEFASALSTVFAQAQSTEADTSQARIAVASQGIIKALEQKDWQLAEQQIDGLSTMGTDGKSAANDLRDQLQTTRDQQASRIAQIKENARWGIEAREWDYAEKQINFLNDEGTEGQSAATEVQGQVKAARQQQNNRVAVEKQRAERAIENKDWAGADTAIRELKSLGKAGSEAAESLQRQLVSARHQGAVAQPQASNRGEPSNTGFPTNHMGHQKTIPRWEVGLGLLVGLAMFIGLVAIAIKGYNDSQELLDIQARARLTVAAEVALASVVTPTPLLPSHTLSPLPPSPTFTPVPPTAIPTLGIGSYRISPIDGMVQSYIPAGTFLMGSNDGEENEQPVHQVTLDAFWIDYTEVTNSQYVLCVAAGACTPPGFVDLSDLTSPEIYYGNSIYNDYPVKAVVWEQAMLYCTWAMRRLPTEAEWEYAARGNDGYTYPWGNIFDGSRLNFCDINCFWEWKNETYNDGFIEVAPVGSYPAGASPFGVLDTAGNVQEWVADRYDLYSSEAVENPTGPDSGQNCVLKDGGYYASEYDVRLSVRSAFSCRYTNSGIGFRCASSP